MSVDNFDAIQAAFDKGWQPFPLPPKKKRFPPKHFTGRNGRKVTQEQLNIWRAEHPRDCNVGLHLTELPNGVQVQDGFGGLDTTSSVLGYQVIGIDVDNYDIKVGAQELARLEEVLGTLPETVSSSARTDGQSGIRLYLAPKGLAFKGKPGGMDVGFNCSSIEIIQHNHRYMVCYPSIHPDGRQYLFYKPGAPIDGNGIPGFPPLKLVAHLPDKWIDHLTAGRMVDGKVALDIESTDEAVLDWYQNRLKSKVGPGVSGDPCHALQAVLNKWIERVGDPTDSHTPLQRGHYELLNFAFEGHAGVSEATRLFNSAWLKTVVTEGKRSQGEAVAEVNRSFIGALRRIKGEVDTLESQGFTKLNPEMCSTEDDWGVGLATASVLIGPGGTPTTVPIVATKFGSENYMLNETGNAAHFLDVFGHLLKWVPNYATGGKGKAGGRWIVLDPETGLRRVDESESVVYKMFLEIQRRQSEDANIMYDNAERDALAQGLVNNAGIPANTKEVALAKSWRQFARDNGNERKVISSLNMAKHSEGVAINFEELDSDPMILPVANGILRFRVPKEPDEPVMEWVSDLDGVIVTQTTGFPYIPLAEQRGETGERVNMGPTPQVAEFDEFMTTFLRNHISEETFTYLHRFLGYSLLGHNRSKQALFLIGKPHTGKTTFQTMIVNALGSLAIWRDPNIFQDTHFKDALAAALARRIVCTGEVGGEKIDVSLFKRIVGGDEVSCNIKNVSAPVTLAARCTVISGCNDAPNIPGLDQATRDRMAVVPFLHVVTPQEANAAKQDYLEKECQIPVLAWLIEGCCDALRYGIGEPPPEVQMAKQQFVEQTSELAVFVSEALQKASPEDWERYRLRDSGDPRTNKTKDRWPDHLCVGDRTLYQRYRTWCEMNGVERAEILTKHMFTKRLSGLGFIQDGTFNKANERRWIGVTLTNGIMQL